MIKGHVTKGRRVAVEAMRVIVEVIKVSTLWNQSKNLRNIDMILSQLTQHLGGSMPNQTTN